MSWNWKKIIYASTLCGMLIGIIFVISNCSSDSDFSYRGRLKVKKYIRITGRYNFGYITPTDIDELEHEAGSIKFYDGVKIGEGFKLKWHYENRLAEYLPLRYDYSIVDAAGVDYLLAKLMKSLWEKPDSVSFADFYWDWAKDISSTIYRLHKEYNMFLTSNDLYNHAMNDLQEYIQPSLDCGFRPEMNAGSYVLGAIENYRMIQVIQEFANSLPDLNIRREYELFNDFMASFEDWRAIFDERNGRYSDWILVQNFNAIGRFKDRRKSMEDMLMVVKGDTIIYTTSEKVSIDKAFENLASAYYPAMELVPLVKARFKKWIDYRNKIVSQMPQNIASSYRHQTLQLEKHYTSDEFFYQDEL